MRTKTRVDSRTFQEFYPDPVVRHKVHYWFAHQFLPKYVHEDPRRFFSYLFDRDTPGGAIEPTLFVHTRWTMFEQRAGLIKVEGDLVKGGMVLRSVSELNMSLHVLADRAVALVQMPSPERPAEAQFVAAALLASPADPRSWPPGLGTRVFTLESLNAEMYPELPDARQRGVFCEWTKSGEHRNFGLLIRAEREAVLQAVARALQAPDAPAAAGFTPPKDGAPGTITFSGGRDSTPQPQPVHEARKPWWKIW
jgi:hypothetical protein